jgi:formyl-CoA transferase/CoA:oxalate CoA-transferase
VPNRLNAILDGVTVVDLTRNLAGPFCTMTLGDLGADVIKVEAPGHGDDSREWVPPAWNGESTVFLAANRNKRSVAVDFDTSRGQEIVRRLAERADVVVESFRPGSLDKRGLGYDALAAVNPRLIFCSISAFGDVGPMAGSPGYDPVLQAYSGVMSMTGEPDRSPVRLGIGAIDLGTGLWATIAIQAALEARRRDGRGCRIDTSLFETAVWWLSYFVTGFLATGVSPRRQGDKTAFTAPYEVFPTADGDLMVAAPNDALFVALARVVGRPDLVGVPRFSTNADRVANRAELREIILERLATATAAQWEERLLAASVPCSRIRSVADVVADRQTAALGVLAAMAHPRIPDLRLVDMPVRTSGERASLRRAPPLLGEHTDDVLAELGYQPMEVADLRRDGVVA